MYEIFIAVVSVLALVAGIVQAVFAALQYKKELCSDKPRVEHQS